MNELSVTCSGCFQDGPAFDRGFALTNRLRGFLGDIRIPSSAVDFDRIDISPTIVPDREIARPWITYSKKHRTIRVSDPIDFEVFVNGDASCQAQLFAKSVANSIRQIKAAVVAPPVAEGLVEALTSAITIHRAADER